MGKLEILDHTADIAFRVYGDTIEELYKMAFDGFLTVSSLKGFRSDSELTMRELSIIGEDHEELLVRFLNELIHLVQDEMTAPVKLEYLKLDDHSLKLGIIVQAFREFPEGYAELKAATYYMLKIEEQYGEFVATCIIDV